MTINIQQERFFLPMGLVEVDRIFGQPIYSSDSTKQSFLNVLKNEQMVKRINPIIKDFVDKRVIIPAFSQKGLIASLINQAFANKDGESLGFYYTGKNRIYILMDSNSAFFWKSGNSLATVTFHEMIHWAARNKTNKFLIKFKRPMIEFYQLFFKLHADIEVSPDKIWRMINFIFDTFELGEPNKKELDNLEHFYLTHISKDQEAVARILIPLNIYLLQSDRFFSSINTDKVINHMVRMLLQCYNDVFGILKPETTPIQELIFPSEIIAVSSIKPTAQHYQVF